MDRLSHVSTIPGRAIPAFYDEPIRARALGAHQNGIEAFPFFAAAVLLAEFRLAPQHYIDELAVLFLIVRIAYVFTYLGNRPTLRSILWSLGFAINIAIFFLPAIRRLPAGVKFVLPPPPGLYPVVPDKRAKRARSQMCNCTSGDPYAAAAVIGCAGRRLSSIIWAGGYGSLRSQGRRCGAVPSRAEDLELPVPRRYVGILVLR